ncbi:MAG: M48 family metalloprotease [Rickettsiales bacterium]
MTDETPTETPPVTPPQNPEWPRPRPVIERPSISRGRKIAMLIVILIATGVLFSLRKTVDHEKEAVAEAKNLLNANVTSGMANKYGGNSANVEQLALVAKVSDAIASKTEIKKRNYKLRVHLLKEPDSINIYALTTGDIYLTTALLNRMQTEGQLAAAIAHAAAHVMGGDIMTEIAGLSHPLPVWSYSGAQEATADKLTVQLMSEAGYAPEAFTGMLGVLAKAYHAGADVMFFTTHPNAEGRVDAITAAITALYPEGVPTILSK